MDIEFMIKNILLALLISSQAFAGLPPPTVKSQSDSTAKTKFQIQAPHNQFTDLGGVKTLIETGNGNILPDPGFEALTSGWTASGGATATANSTAKGTGAKGFDWDSNSAGQTLVSTSVTIPNGYQGKNGFFSCNIKTVSGTATHTIMVDDGTNPISTAFTITSSTTSFASTYEASGQGNFIYPSSGTIRIKLTSVNANEPEIYVDDCKIVLSEGANVGSVSPQAVLFDAITVTGCAAAWEISGPGSSLTAYPACTGATYTSQTGKCGTPATNVPGALCTSMPAGDYRIEYEGRMGPNGTTGTLQSNQFSDGTVTARELSVIQGGTNGTMFPGISQSFSYTAPKSSVTWQLKSSVSDANNPKVYGTTANPGVFKIWYFPPRSQQAVSSANADYDWTSYTPTFTGFGTPSSVECQHSRVSSDLLLRCKWTSGTPTATEARLSLPNSLVSADTTKIPTIQKAGEIGISVNSATIYYALIEPSVSYFTFSIQGASNNALTKLLGNAFTANGVVNSMQARIPIQGWSSNQRAPTLVGSVTSNSTGAMRFESATISNTGTPTLVNQSSSWVNSLTDNGTGDTTVNFTAGTFSSTPWCTCSSYDGDFAHCSLDATTAISSSLVRVQTDSNGSSAADRQFILMCIGPR